MALTPNLYKILTHLPGPTSGRRSLKKEEVEELNRIVTMYLDYAEDQDKRKQTVSMAQWADKLDAFLKFNERDLLTHAGKVKMEVAQKLATDRYEEFDAKRKETEAQAADEEDIRALEGLANTLKRKKRLMMTLKN